MSSNSLESLLAPFTAIAEQLQEQNGKFDSMLTLMETQNQKIAKLQEENLASRKALENLRAITGYPMMREIRETFRGKQLSFLDTLSTIASEELSFARFGDGELRNMFRPEFSIYFQKNSAALASDLRSAMAAEGTPNLLVGMPNIFSDQHWTTVFHEVWDQMLPYVENLPLFGNLHVTRPVMFQAHGHDAVAAWRKLWNGREALIVTGKGSRFDLHPALFDNLKSSRFEYSTPRDAYDDVDRIEAVVRDAPERLILISLGPTGSVLAHRLAKAGKQALDLGHLASSYTHIMQGGAFPEKTALARK